MTARDRFLNAGAREVLLPSGARVRGVMPTWTELVRKRLVSAELQRAVASANKAIVEGRSLSIDEQAAGAESRMIEAAAFVRAIWDEDTKAWEPVALTAADLTDGFADPDDVDALEDIITARKTPEQVTAESLAGQPATTPEAQAEADAAAAQEAGSAVSDWRDFRDERRGDVDRGDGGAVRPAPVDGDRPPARRRRPRSQPGAGASPSAG